MTSPLFRPPSRRRFLQLGTAALPLWLSSGHAHAGAQVLNYPPSTRLLYDLHRGAVSGKGELTWSLQGARYQVRLEGTVPVFGSILVQTSQGGTDTSGLAPARHTEKRIGRGERSVSFQRAADPSTGTLVFSHATDKHALHAGTQDRVSWMPQLATLLRSRATQPPAAGTTFPMDVVGTSGALRRWVFRMVDVSPEGWYHLRRELPNDPDAHSEVWMDPKRQCWPVRVRLSDGNGDPLELVLRDTQTP